jgi:lipid-binding SYLF domain-containing protein
MEKIIEHCNTALNEAAAKKVIPDSVWKACKGVAIISVFEFGIVVLSMSDGEGAVIQKNDDGTWGAPSALLFSSDTLGVTFGMATKQIFLFPMTELGLKRLSGETSLELGAKMGIAVGLYGSEHELGENRGEDVTYTYTFEKGVMMNIGWGDSRIDAYKKANRDFYGKNVDPLDIVMTPGAVEVPTGKGIEEIHKKLEAFSMN